MDGVSRWLLYSSVKFSITQLINRVALLCRNSVWLNVGFLVSIKTDNYNKFYSIFYLCWFQVMSLFGHTCTVPWLFLLLAILFCLSQQQYYLIVPVSTSPSSSVEIRLSKSIRYFSSQNYIIILLNSALNIQVPRYFQFIDRDGSFVDNGSDFICRCRISFTVDIYGYPQHFNWSFCLCYFCHEAKNLATFKTSFAISISSGSLLSVFYETFRHRHPQFP